MLERYGTREQLALKRQVIDAVTAGRGPSALMIADDRLARATVRVALRQMQAAGPETPALLEWLSGYDRTAASADEDPAEALH